MKKGSSLREVIYDRLDAVRFKGFPPRIPVQRMNLVLALRFVIRNVRFKAT